MNITNYPTTMRTVLALTVRKPASACSHNLHATQNEYEGALYSLEFVMHSFTVRNSYSFNEMIR